MTGNNIAGFLSRRFGFCFYDDKTYSMLNQCLSLYKNEAQGYHTLTLNDGLRVFKDTVYRLNMAKRIAEDWCSSVVSEDWKVKVNSANRKTSVFLQGSKGSGGVLGSNDFADLLPTVLEQCFALGTSALVLGLDNAVVYGDGTIARSGETRLLIDGYAATNIYILKSRNRRIIDAAFVQEFREGDKELHLVSAHVLEGTGSERQYVIYNFVLDGNMRPIDYNGIIPVIKTGSIYPWFCIFRTDIVNNFDMSSPLGLSVYANAFSNLQAVDLCYHECVSDVLSGQRIIFMHRNLLAQDSEGNVTPPQSYRQRYMQYVGDDFVSAEGKERELIKEFNPTLNTDKLDAELQHQLNLLSDAVGLGVGFYNYDRRSGMTATQYIGEHQEMYRNAAKLSSGFAASLRVFFNQVIFAGYCAIDESIDKNARVEVELSDGYIESDEQKKESDRKDVNAGLMSKVEYRMKWFGETEKQAIESLAKIDGKNAGGTADNFTVSS